MKYFVIGTAMAVVLSGGVGLAQTSQGATGAQMSLGATGQHPAGSDRSAVASGDTNQAVATTNANAPAPAKGANSFTMGQARTRIEKEGFSNVADLSKDDNGVWHGKATKHGTTTTVWLDYKGNVGQAQ